MFYSTLYIVIPKVPTGCQYLIHNKPEVTTSHIIKRALTFTRELANLTFYENYNMYRSKHHVRVYVTVLFHIKLFFL